jgi:hypothetical protein
LTVTSANPDGSKTTINQHYAGGKAQIVNAYSTKRDQASGTMTRTYLDGRKVVNGRDFVRLTVPGRYAVTTHSDGLREAYRANGKPMYREHWETRRYNGVETRVVSRTVYSETVINRTVFYSEPVVRVYVPAEYYGVPVLAYQPFVFQPVFLGPFLVGFAQPFIVTPGCVVCPSAVVAFAQPVQQYNDPVDLVGDLQISSAVSDGDGQAGGPPPPPATSDPEVAQLAQNVAALQAQVDAETAKNAELQSEIDSLKQQSATAQSSQSAPTAQSAAYVVPEDVRRQIHRQVRKNIELHESNRALTWADLVKSGEARDNVFQVSEMISTVDTNGEECALSGGDLLKLDDGTAPDDPALRMRVVTSKGTSCRANSVVNISIADAQGMLNDFNARQEAIMKQVHPLLARNDAA